MNHATLLVALLSFATAASAQVVIGIDDLTTTTGTSNAFPFNVAGGQTSLHVYSAQTLHNLGICAGSVLLDLEVAPSSGSSGTYNAPQAQMQIGHLAVSPPVAGNWGAHLNAPTMVHDLTAGPYTFPWTVGSWAPLPGFSTSFFVWNGIDDIGIQYTSSAGVTGPFQARRTATQLRHYVAIFNASTQLPTSNGLFAMKVRMTWLTSGCASKFIYGSGCDSPALALNSNLPVLGTTFTMTTSNLSAVSPVGILFVGDTQLAVDLTAIGAPGCFALSSGNLASATFPSVAGTGSISLPVPLNPALLGATFTSQAAGLTLANALNIATSNGLQWTLGF